MTNLEWIRTLSAEDLSQWFYGEWLARLQYRWSSSQGGLVIWLKEQRAEQRGESDDDTRSDARIDCTT